MRANLQIPIGAQLPKGTQDSSERFDAAVAERLNEAHESASASTTKRLIFIGFSLRRKKLVNEDNTRPASGSAYDFP